MSNRDTLINQILNEQKNISEIRKRERVVQKIEKNVLPIPQKNQLEEYLGSILPDELMPSNVGDISRIQWGFFHQCNFDFGTNPSYDYNTRKTDIIKVNADAAFMITRIYRNTDDSGNSGFKAPLGLYLRDLQSSRQLMDKMIPLQAIPGQGDYFELPVPFLLYPSSRAEVELRSWLPNGIDPLATTGSGVQSLTFYGAKVRAQDYPQLARTFLRR
jgi:hypothetical protein